MLTNWEYNILTTQPTIIISFQSKQGRVLSLTAFPTPTQPSRMETNFQRLSGPDDPPPESRGKGSVLTSRSSCQLSWDHVINSHQVVF